MWEISAFLNIWRIVIQKREQGIGTFYFFVSPIRLANALREENEPYPCLNSQK